MKLNKKIFTIAALIAVFSFNTINVQALTISKQFINNNRSYQNLKPTGIVIHDTANPGATAQNNRDYFNRERVGASAHYFVDWNTTIQTIPNTEVAWHAGYTANHRYLSIEMCNPRPENKTQFNTVYKNTVDLAATLCKKYRWNVRDNVFSHKFISDTFKQTDHQDPYAFLASYGKTWNDLLIDIQNKINGNDIKLDYGASEVVSIPSLKFSYNNNAKIEGDDLYIRDLEGNRVPGRYVANGDNITVIDISYSKQLALVEYPTAAGVRKGYVKNIPSIIRYYNQDQYKNGSTKETVYLDSSYKTEFGSLSAYEKATPLYKKDGKLCVVYSTIKGKNTKNGFVKYNGNFSFSD